MNVQDLTAGTVIRHNDELDWPAFTVTGVHETVAATVAGRPIGAFVVGEWADRRGKFASMHLPTVLREWHLA